MPLNTPSVPQNTFRILEWVAALWLGVFIAIPAFGAFLWSFLNLSSPSTFHFTLQHYKSLWTSAYLQILTTSYILAFFSTMLSLVFSYSLLFILKKPTCVRMNPYGLVLILLPFTTNSLFRIYGLKQFLICLDALLRKSAGLFPWIPSFYFLHSSFAVILGISSVLFPFTFFPLWLAAKKIDPSQIEAAKDLGASEWSVFRYIVFPQTYQAMRSGFILTLLPSMGLFYVADFLGGPKQILWGALLKSELLILKNPPGAAAASCTLFLTLGLWVMLLQASTSLCHKWMRSG